MNGLSHILLASDGSESALHAAAYAGMLARLSSAKITLATVHQEDMLLPAYIEPVIWPGAMAAPAMSIEEIHAAVERNAENELFPAVITACGEGVNIAPPVQLWGHVAESLCEYAQDHQVDMIVIGTRGHSSFKKLLLGSVSTQVANHAHCPVTLVR